MAKKLQKFLYLKMHKNGPKKEVQLFLSIIHMTTIFRIRFWISDHCSIVKLICYQDKFIRFSSFVHFKNSYFPNLVLRVNNYFTRSLFIRNGLIIFIAEMTELIKYWDNLWSLSLNNSLFSFQQLKFNS